MTEYVLGFLFNASGERVVLIRKNRPRWQAGLLNGIGGHIEAGETPIEAMVREFREETSLTHRDWKKFSILGFPGGRVHIYKAFTDTLDQVRTMTDEAVEIRDASALPEDVVFNVRWMIPLALDPDFYGVAEVVLGKDDAAAA